MYCEKCEKEINDDALFCKYCGAKVERKANSKNANIKEVQIHKDGVADNRKDGTNSIIEIESDDSNSKISNKSKLIIALVVVLSAIIIVAELLVGFGVIGREFYQQKSESLMNIKEGITTTNTTSGTIFLDDKAGLLTSTESKSVLEELTKESEDSNCVITVITTNEGLSESEIHSYSDNYYSRIIEDKANINFSVILTVDISSRKVDVCTFNPGSKRNLNSSELNKLREYVTDDLSNGDYEEAFIKFADKASSMAGNISESDERV